MTKKLSDVAVVVRCKPLAEGPNGIPVPVINGGGSLGGLTTVRATNPKQVNAQKLGRGDVVVTSESVVMLIGEGDVAGQCINDKGFIIIRFASDADVELYVAYLRHVMEDALRHLQIRETYNDISTGDLTMPDPSLEGANDAFARAQAARKRRSDAEKIIEQARDDEMIAWSEMFA